MNHKGTRSGDAPIGIIGGGLGGLAAAVTLAGRGHKVVLFEKNEWLGGKAAVLERDGFRFDMGPTILTVPSVLRRVFAEAGRTLELELDMVRLDPQWRCFFDDGAALDLAQSIPAMASNIEALAPGDGEGYRRFMSLSRELDEISQRFFFWRSVEDMRDTFDAAAGGGLATLGAVLRLRMGQSVAGVIGRHVRDKRVAQLLEHFTQYVGSAPANRASTLSRAVERAPTASCRSRAPLASYTSSMAPGTSEVGRPTCSTSRTGEGQAVKPTAALVAMPVVITCTTSLSPLQPLASVTSTW